MTEEEIIHIIALNLTQDIGSQRVKLLIEHFGSAKNVLQLDKEDLLNLKGIGQTLANSILKAEQNISQAERIFEANSKHNIQTITFSSDGYPSRLKEIHDAPILFFYKGNADLEHRKILSIVGTRNATKYGLDFTEKIIEQLAPMNCLIMSGLAYGIDIAAHKAALKHNIPTIGVMASGLDIIYPSKHKHHAEKMIQHGGLLTEKALGVKPEARFFPARNRIVAGMTDAVLVVEAAKSGGALITAEIAHSYNKDVFALPGNVSSVYSEGTNSLIKRNKAQLITSASDLAYHLNWELTEFEQKVSTKKIETSKLNSTEKSIISCLQETNSLPIDQLSWKSSVPINELAGSLLKLEFEGIISQLPGKVFKLN